MRPLKYILALFLSTRIALTIIGVTSRHYFELHHRVAHDWVGSSYRWLDIWGQWDSGWYLQIAKTGYSTLIGGPGPTLGQANYGFFPLYPLIVKFFAFFTGHHFLVGLILSNLFLIGSAWLLFEIVRKNYGEETAYSCFQFLRQGPFTQRSTGQEYW